MNKTYTITYSVNLDGDEIIEGKVFSFNATPENYLNELTRIIDIIKEDVIADYSEESDPWDKNYITVKVWY